MPCLIDNDHFLQRSIRNEGFNLIGVSERNSEILGALNIEGLACLRGGGKKNEHEESELVSSRRISKQRRIVGLLSDLL